MTENNPDQGDERDAMSDPEQIGQATLLRETGNGPTEDDEEQVLEELYGPADADGVYGPRDGDGNDDVELVEEEDGDA